MTVPVTARGIALFLFVLVLLEIFPTAALAWDAERAAPTLSVARIFDSDELRAKGYAARWLKSRPAGFYDMQDVLGLR